MVTKEKIRSKIDILEKRMMSIYNETFEREFSSYELSNLKVELKELVAKIDILEELLNE